MTNVYSTTRLGAGPIPTDPSLIIIDPQEVEANTVYADIIQIQWAATDSDILRLMSETRSSSSLRTPSTAAHTAHQTIANVAQTGSPTSAPKSTQRAQNERLSAGAKAGIGIGAAIGAIALTLLGYFLWRWRRRKPQNNGIEDGSNTSNSNTTKYRFAHELPPAQEKVQFTGPAELPSEVAHELPADEARSKLESDAMRYSICSGTTNTMSSSNPSQKLG